MAEETQDADGLKGSSKILIIIIIVLLLIIIGGGVAFFLMGSSEDPTAEGEDAQEVAEEVVEEEVEPAINDMVYYELEEPLRVNFPKGSAARLIEVKLALLLKNKDVEEDMEKHEPMIVNNLLMAISAAGAEKLKQTEGKDELRTLMLEEIQKVMTKMTGKKQVKEVFFTSFVMQ